MTFQFNPDKFYHDLNNGNIVTGRFANTLLDVVSGDKEDNKIAQALILLSFVEVDKSIADKAKKVYDVETE